MLNQYGNPEIAIRLNEAEQFNLRNFEDVLICKQKSQDLMQKNKEALMQYVEEIKNLRNLILNDLSTGTSTSLTEGTGDKKLAEGQQIKVGGNVVPSLQGNLGQQTTAAGAQQPQAGVLSNNRENILRKALKCKQLEDDNKKLRKLLKTQIENSEQLRQDTHNTIETLREEFDILVRELLQYKQNDANNKTNPGRPGAGASGVPAPGNMPTQPSGAAGGPANAAQRGAKRPYGAGKNIGQSAQKQ